MLRVVMAAVEGESLESVCDQCTDEMLQSEYGFPFFSFRFSTIPSPILACHGNCSILLRSSLESVNLI